MSNQSHEGQRGSIAVFLGLALPVLLGVAGLALDSGNLYLAHTQLQRAADSAALAGALKLPWDPDMDQGIVEGAIKDMVEKNYPSATITSITPGTEVRSVKVVLRSTVDYWLMGVLGLYSGQVEVQASAGFNNLELCLVIDNTGSMAGTPLDRTKSAAIDLVDLVLPDGMAPSTKVGLVPFRGKVRVGADVDGLEAGCRNANGTLNTTNSDSCFKGMPQTLALSTVKTTITSSINSMTGSSSYSSGTIIAEGLKWGRNVLTSEAPYTQGGDKDKYRKIMIVLTDGDNEDGYCGGTYANTSKTSPYRYNSYFGMGVTTCHCETGGCLDQATLSEAQKTKDAGIEIFTIRFGTSDSNDVSIMKKIASSTAGTTDHYFDAPTAASIEDVFKEIGKHLGWRLL